MPKMEWCIINKNTNGLLLLKDDNGINYAIVCNTEEEAYDLIKNTNIMPKGEALVCQRIIFGPKLGYVDALLALGVPISGKVGKN